MNLLDGRGRNVDAGSGLLDNALHVDVVAASDEAVVRLGNGETDRVRLGFLIRDGLITLDNKHQKIEVQ